MSRISNKAKAEQFATENGIELINSGYELEYDGYSVHLSSDRCHCGVFEIGNFADFKTEASAYGALYQEMKYLKPCDLDCDCYGN